MTLTHVQDSYESQFMSHSVPHLFPLSLGLMIIHHKHCYMYGSLRTPFEMFFEKKEAKGQSDRGETLGQDFLA